MTALPDWAPEGIDLGKASAARMYDYFLGGAHNFAVDRDLARQVLRLHPPAALNAQANRAFLHRAVRHLLAQGVRQFIDLGSGIPTVGNVHEAAEKGAPGSKVLYIDRDPIAVAHSELILQGNPNARVLQADARRPMEILESAELHDLIDMSQPVAVLMVAVVHFFSEDDNPQEAIGQFRDALAPGSFLVLSHGHSDKLAQGRPAELSPDEQKVLGLYLQTSGPITVRSREQIAGLFTGFDLVDPGLAWAPEWKPDWPDEVGPDPSASSILVGVGRRG